MLESVRRDLREAAQPKRAADLAWFFKTGPGEYAEGDRFLGVRVPALRRVARGYWDSLSLEECSSLLDSEWHEERLFGLLVMVRRFSRAASSEARRPVVSLYLARTDRVNNWDLVDASAPEIVGAWLLGDGAAERDELLDRLVASSSLWERRIAMVSTFAFIRAGELDDTFRLAEALRDDREDLIHKATGWMLREAGKRDSQRLVAWLEGWAPRLPRTALRYSIERLPVDERARLMALR